MEPISLKSLLEAGCHFGHQTNRWHPKALPFIYQARKGIHIIDLSKTKEQLEKAAEVVYDLGRKDGVLLMVGTKRQAKGVVAEEAKRVGAAFLTQRWIGGFLTNWNEVKKNIEKMNAMRESRDKGEWEKYPKHERVALDKDLRRLELFYGGVADLKDLPEMIFIVDIKNEKAAVLEVKRLKIPSIGIVDTNSDPMQVEYPIPSNDDAVGSIKYIVSHIAQAYFEGKTEREKKVSKIQKRKSGKRAETRKSKETKKRKSGKDAEKGVKGKRTKVKAKTGKTKSK